MKDDFPERAVICVDTDEDLVALLEFFDLREVPWRNHATAIEATRFIRPYMEQNGQVCISLQYGELGYCYRAFYASRGYFLNYKDQKWNFCSAHEFITWNGGSPPEKADIAFDFDSIL